MKLRPRLTLFTIFLVVVVVGITSVSTIFSFQYLLRQEMENNQRTHFVNFLETSRDQLYLGDDLAIKAYSESLEKSVVGLTYAIFVDHTRPGIILGGVESLQRYKRHTPECGGSESELRRGDHFTRITETDSGRWSFFCQEIDITNIRGEHVVGTVFMGFNLDILGSEQAKIFDRMWLILGWSIVFVLIVGLILSYFLASRLTQPIQQLTDGAKAIGEGRLDTKIPIHSSDELGFLAQEFNWMALKLRELDQLKDDFVSSVSHELRSPLSAISGYVELLRNKDLADIPKEKREKALGIIAESTSRLTQFINDILDLAKLKSGHVDIRNQPLDIQSVGDDVMTLFHPLFEKKQIKGELDIAGDVPVLTADDDKIRQVVTNLVSNALKFTESGGTIGIKARNHTEFIQVTVWDTGIGVPKDSLELVFERFRQVPGQPQTFQGPKGTGLGLAIAKGIIEAQGGRIWMESEVGKGTAVHFTLPNRPAPMINAPGLN